MGWYSIKDSEGREVFKFFASSLEALVANTPTGHTATPIE